VAVNREAAAHNVHARAGRLPGVPGPNPGTMGVHSHAPEPSAGGSIRREMIPAPILTAVACRCSALRSQSRSPFSSSCGSLATLMAIRRASSPEVAEWTDDV
jgi:hypothetical protein